MWDQGRLRGGSETNLLSALRPSGSDYCGGGSERIGQDCRNLNETWILRVCGVQQSSWWDSLMALMNMLLIVIDSWSQVMCAPGKAGPPGLGSATQWSRLPLPEQSLSRTTSTGSLFLHKVPFRIRWCQLFTAYHSDDNCSLSFSLQIKCFHAASLID